MCVICVSEKGVRQPSKELLRRMFYANPHGAGYMVAENGRVRISKGYMTFESLWHALCAENFGKNDVVVYHFRISTQAGVQPAMTQPFPFTKKIENTKALDCISDLGIAHNGIIKATTDKNDREYSDTARFIVDYLSAWVKSRKDFTNEFLDELEWFTNSRFAFLDGKGNVFYVGKFIEDYDGLMFSNKSYLGFRLKGRTAKKVSDINIWKKTG